MKFNKTLIATFVTFSCTNVLANDWTANAVLKNETAAFTNGGSVVVGESTAKTKSGDVFKSESSARIFLNGDVGENATGHIELRPVYDSEAINSDNDSHESYSQRDFLREAYIDTNIGDVAVRIGKQQVVWGKADGAKFLDMLNPTDYREMAQNSMDESRIPVWMINAEKILDNGATIQAVVSQSRENTFAGLNRNIATGQRVNNTSTFADLTTNNGTDNGHPFMLMGPDSITGVYNGFLNITPDLGGVAGRFAGGFGGIGELSSALMAGFTLTAFEAMDMNTMAEAMYGATGGPMICAGDGVSSSSCTVSSAVANTNFSVTTTNATTIAATIDYTDLPDAFEAAVAGVATNLSISDPNDVTGQQMLAYGFAPYYNTNLADMDSIDDTAFDYMGSANFRTFDTFVNAGSEYVFKMPDDFDVDLGFKFSNTTDNGVNYSFVYSYSYDKNPIIDLSWHDDATGALLTQSVDAYNTVTLANGGTSYGGNAGNYATLRFTQSLERTSNFGGAVDFAVDTESLGPVVIRGEALYTKGAKQPVMDKGRLAIGDLINALTMQEQDRFKYVVGADVTVATDMMVSAQFIQERNLDFIDTAGYSGVSGSRKYTTDYATMHLTNGFQKAIENKEFYSLFLSKPFGESGEGRWNNILMLEEGGGRWNRFDVEYSLSNEVVGTFEVNKYWGDANSQFGQLENSSNIQVGLKYIIE